MLHRSLDHLARHALPMIHWHPSPFPVHLPYRECLNRFLWTSSKPIKTLLWRRQTPSWSSILHEDEWLIEIKCYVLALRVISRRFLVYWTGIAHLVMNFLMVRDNVSILGETALLEVLLNEILRLEYPPWCSRAGDFCDSLLLLLSLTWAH